MPRVQIHNVGGVGVTKDIPNHQLAPEVWSDGANVRFNKRNAARIGGHSQVFGTPSVAPGFVLSVPGSSGVFWVYVSLTQAHVWDGSVHTDITRSAGAVPYTAVNERDWNGCILGGIPILNNGSDVPQYWPSLSVGTDLANLVNWPATLRAKVIRNFGKFLVALNLVDGGVALPHAFRWSHGADPGTVPSSWSLTDATIDAGQRHLTDIEGGSIQDAVLLGNQLIVYKQRSTHALRIVGGQEIIASDLLLATMGVLSMRCACAIDNGTRHFVVTEGDIITHQGTKDFRPVGEGKIKDTVFAELDAINFANSFVAENANNNEVWFCYPTSGNVRPNKALIWNYRYDAWGFRDFSGMWATQGVAQVTGGQSWDSLTNTWDQTTDPWSRETRRQFVVADPSMIKFWLMDSGFSFGGVSPLAFLERTGIAIVGRDREGRPKLDFSKRRGCGRIWPKITGGGVVTVRVGAQELEQDTVTWQSPQAFNPLVDKYVDFNEMANGVLLAVRFETTHDNFWQLEGFDMDIMELGTL